MELNKSKSDTDTVLEVENSLDDLVRLTYDELKRLASSFLHAEYGGHTLQPTALVHEVYLNLTLQKKANWKDKPHFLAIAAKCMRRVLVDHARTKNAQKRWGAQRRISLDGALIFAGERSLDVISLDRSLRRLELIDSRQARVVELRFFGGLTVEETADVLAIFA